MTRVVKSLPVFLVAAVVAGPSSVVGLVWLLAAAGFDTTQFPGPVYVVLLTGIPALCIYALGKALDRTGGGLGRRSGFTRCGAEVP